MLLNRGLRGPLGRESLLYSSQTILGLLHYCEDICVSDLLPSIFYAAAEYFYQLAMTYRVKEAFKVKVDYVFIAFIYCLLRSSQGIMTPETVTCLGKLTLIYRGQYLVDGGLNQPVYYGGNAQKPFLAIFFWDFYPANRVGTVSPGLQRTY